MLLESLSIILNLAKACIGTGILAYPFLIGTYGLFSVVLLTSISAAASMCGCILYVELNERRKKGRTIATLCDNVPAPLQHLISFVVVLKCFITTLVYLNILEEIVKEELLYKLTDKSASAIFFFTIFPSLYFISNHRKIMELRLFSFLGLVGVAFLFAGAIFLSRGAGLAVPLVTRNFNFSKYLGFFIFSFNCQHALLKIHNESSISSLSFRFCIFFVFLFSSLVYVLFGCINCLFINNLTANSNVLNLWPAGKIRNLIQCCYGCVIAASVALQVNPICTHVVNLTYGTIPEFVSLFLVLLAAHLLVCFQLVKFEVLVRFVSNPFSTLMSFVFPALFLFIEKGRASLFYRCIAWFTLLFGLLCILSLMINLIKIH